MKHTTADRETMHIAQMEDSHLENTINMHIRNLKALYQALTTGGGSSMSSILYESEFNPEDIKRRIKQIDTILPFYIMEACIRGKDFTSDIQEAYCRKEKVPTIMSPAQLLPETSSPSDDYELGVDDLPF